MRGFALLSTLALAACGPSRSAPAMRVAAPVDVIPTAEARVVFVRAASSCDTVDYASVVDDRGKLVANLTPDTTTEVSVSPGRSTFYVWPGFDLTNIDFVPNVVRVEAESGKNVYVTVRIPQGPSLRCPKYSYFHFAPLRAEERDEVLSRATRLVRDDAAAWSWEERERAKNQTYLARAQAFYGPDRGTVVR